jgi:hypothetical protein
LTGVNFEYDFFLPLCVGDDNDSTTNHPARDRGCEEECNNPSACLNYNARDLGPRIVALRELMFGVLSFRTQVITHDFPPLE